MSQENLLSVKRLPAPQDCPEHLLGINALTDGAEIKAERMAYVEQVVGDDAGVAVEGEDWSERCPKARTSCS